MNSFFTINNECWKLKTNATILYFSEEVVYFHQRKTFFSETFKCHSYLDTNSENIECFQKQKISSKMFTNLTKYLRLFPCNLKMKQLGI